MYVSSQVQSVIRWITSSGTQFGREQEDDENGILGCQGGVSLRNAKHTRKDPIRPPSSHKTKPPPAVNRNTIRSLPIQPHPLPCSSEIAACSWLIVV